VADLYERLNRLQRELLPGAVEDCLGGATGIEQDRDAATYACTRVPADGEIDWTAPTTVIDRLVRALTAPYPGAFTYLGLQRVWISRAAPSPEPPTYVGRVPGRVVRVDREAGWIVKSLKDTLGLRPAALLDRLTTLERQLSALRADRD
jgi:methionyl-tRNA formyltransferase